MPKQRRRRESQRRQDERRRRRQAEGRWEVLFETTDMDEMRDYRGRLSEEHPSIDADDLREEVLCGRLEQPTWYRISRLVPR